MKKVLIGALAIGSVLSGGAAFAGQTEEILARLDSLEKENAAIRRENAALQQNKSLREQNAALKSSTARSRAVAQPVATVSAPPAVVAAPAVEVAAAPAEVAAAKPKTTKERLADFFGAYAADLPVAYKARPVTPGQIRFWGEGGAIWSGGDRVLQDFNLVDFNDLGSILGGLGGFGGGGGIPRQFNLTPTLGWEVATGFDYKFANNSPWHVSGQFRYGEGGHTSGGASSAGSNTLGALLAPIPLPPQAAGTVISGSHNVSAAYKEYHWLADIAVGYEIVFAGPATAYASAPASLQIKGGIRTEEFVGRLSTNNTLNVNVVIPPPAIPVIGNNFSITNATATDTRNTFLGAGPLIGIEGSIPFFGNWTFDYVGDAAILFGTQQSTTTTTNTLTASPAILALLFGGGGGINTATAERFGYVMSTDVQAGFGYWVTPNVKLAASYRLDAIINVQNQRNAAVANLTPDRYTHGPRLTITGRF